MKVIKDIKNDLLKRREVSLVVEADKNPGFAESGKKIAEHFKAKEENIVIKEVESQFGSHEFTIKAFIYDSPEDKARVEPKKKAKKTEGGASVATPAAPAAPAK